MPKKLGYVSSTIERPFQVDFPFSSDRKNQFRAIKECFGITSLVLNKWMSNVFQNYLEFC